MITCPTKYKKEYCKQLFDYFNQAPYKKENGQIVANDYISLNNFACAIGVNRHSLRNWAKEHPEFGEVYEMARQYQERYITINGLKGLIPPTFAQFIAINHLKMKTKAEGEDAPVVNLNYAQFSEAELDKQIAEREKAIKLLEGKK